MGTYVHDWSPIIFELFGPLSLRWYGLSYLVGFILGFFVLKSLSKKKLWVLPPDQVSDFIGYAALFGVFLGGRLGYVLFYMIPDHGITSVLKDPLSIIRVWEGGMASHGGILGLMIFTFFYSKAKKVSWTGLGDGLCIVAPIGIFMVRLANFINGELYGRVDPNSSFAIKFPSALMDPRAPEYANQQRAFAEANLIQPGVSNFEQLLTTIRENDTLKSIIEPMLEPRHPSQLYEAVLEGALLFCILISVRLIWKKLPTGIITGLFFILYAVGRITAELFREPDSAMIGLLTKGQFYSVFMIVIGLVFVISGALRGKNLQNNEK